MKYFKKYFCHFFKINSLHQQHITLYRTMIPNIVPRLLTSFYSDADINWWHTPPESPNSNPIKNLWHELKEFIRREVKLTTKQELVSGISTFWDVVDVRKCCHYIGHLHKVLPKIIEKGGDTNGY